MKRLIFIGMIWLVAAHSFGSKFVHNAFNEIDACEGKIILTLVNTWNNDEVDDENQFFRFPCDIKIDREGLVYVADSGNNRIQVFDRSANFKKTIGRIGQGPGDLALPEALGFDMNGNLLVSERDNMRLQAFDKSGNSIFIFKTPGGAVSGFQALGDNEIATYSFAGSHKSGNLITVCNTKGKVIRRFGEFHRQSGSLLRQESILFVADSKNNLYGSFYATPVYKKYSYGGEISQVVAYEVPFQAPKPVWDKAAGKIKILGEVKNRVAAGIAVDQKGRIYLASTTRAKKKKREVFFLVSDGPGNMRRYPKGPYPEKTDMFRLLVFSPSGKIIAAKRLDVFCDRLYVHNDTLFIIDTYMGMKIYEYKISFVE